MKARIVYGRKKQFFLDDKEVTREEFDAACPNKIVDILKAGIAPATLMETSKSWPRLSDAMGIHPDQKAKMQAKLAKLGVPTDFNEDGRAVVRSNSHQRDLQKALGIHNNDAGYGQVTG